MFNKIKNWFTRGKRLEAELQRLEEIRASEAVRTAALQDEVDAIKAKKEGTEPWVEITSSKYDEVKGIMIELDWNDAFILHLRESGMEGKDEDVLVQRWIALLYEDLISNLEERSIKPSRMNDNSPNDFE